MTNETRLTQDRATGAVTESDRDRLYWLWENETNDPETQEWRSTLTPAERTLVSGWDQGFARGVSQMYRDSRRLPHIVSGMSRAELEEFRLWLRDCCGLDLYDMKPNDLHRAAVNWFEEQADQEEQHP